MDATIHKHIHQVFEAVMELEPLSPSATPGTKKDFANTVDAFQHYSDLTMRLEEKMSLAVTDHIQHAIDQYFLSLWICNL